MRNGKDSVLGSVNGKWCSHNRLAGRYDGLNRLKEFRRGTLDDPPDSIADGNTTRRQVFTLDQVGNWTEFKKDDDGSGGNDGSAAWDLDQNRAHNKANEIANHGGDPIWPEPNNGTPDWTDPDYDARGNTTKAPVPGDEANHYYTLTYDAWNRLVKVQDDTPATVAEYRYDGTGRRIRKYTDPDGDNWTVREYYYNNSWQMLEVRKQIKSRETGEPELAETLYEQYVWSARYIDALVLRDRDADGNSETGHLGKSGSGLEERLYYLNDANMNVTALVNTSGTVVERCVYDPYGKPKFYDQNWGSPSDTSSYDNEILYCGYRYDPETGLYHIRERMYHPTLGRWLQRDPSGYIDGMSLYEYAKTAPLIGSDPTGRAVVVVSGLFMLSSHGEDLARAVAAKIYQRVRKYEMQYAWTMKFMVSPVGGKLLGGGNQGPQDELESLYKDFVNRKKQKTLIVENGEGVCGSLEQFVVIGHSDGATAIYRLLNSGEAFFDKQNTPAFIGMVDLVRLGYAAAPWNVHDPMRKVGRFWREESRDPTTAEISPDTPGFAKVPKPPGTVIHNYFQPNWSGVFIFPVPIKGRYVFGADRNAQWPKANHISIWKDSTLHNMMAEAAAAAYEQRVKDEMRRKDIGYWFRDITSDQW